MLNFPIELGGKTILIDVAIVKSLMEFNFLLGCDYVYAMQYVVSLLFCVIRFLHE